MKIAFLLYDRLTALDVVGPYEVLQALPGAQLRFVAAQPGPVGVDSGAFSFVAPFGFADVPAADVLIVPGSSSGTRAAMQDPALVAWVQRVHATTRVTASVCSGALVLAAAGLLAGQPATTHWAAMPYLAGFGARACPDERIVEAGKIVTAAGVSAGIDLALFLAARLAGRERAEAIQLMIEYDPRPPFDAGHWSKAAPAVRALAEAEMRRASGT
jgi:transcriptional regulator GlxA family with amidase domain